MGFIPFDKNVPKAVKKQEPFISLYPETEASESVENLAYKLLDRKKEQKSKGVKGFMYRIVGLFNRS